MELEGIAPSAIRAFESSFQALASGSTGIIPEASIEPVPDLVEIDTTTGPTMEVSLKDASLSSLLEQTVMLKLNGGLGTGMGLDKAKSLLPVKGEETFLDLTAQQVLQKRRLVAGGAQNGKKAATVKFMLMNSFSTSHDTMAFLQAKYPSLAYEPGLEMMQNKVPKVDATTLEVSCHVDSSHVHSSTIWRDSGEFLLLLLLMSFRLFLCYLYNVLLQYLF